MTDEGGGKLGRGSVGGSWAELGVTAGSGVSPFSTRKGGGGGEAASVGAEVDAGLLRVAGPTVGVAQGSTEVNGVILRRNLRFLWVGARLPCMRTM